MKKTYSPLIMLSSSAANIIFLMVDGSAHIITTAKKMDFKLIFLSEPSEDNGIMTAIISNQLLERREKIINSFFLVSSKLNHQNHSIPSNKYGIHN